MKLRPAFNYPLIVNYIRSGWACPGVIADSMGSLVRIAERVFMTRRQHLLKKFEIKASASDLMAMAPLFRVIVDETVKPFGLEALIKPIRSFDACMEVLDCYIAIKRDETVLEFPSLHGELHDLPWRRLRASFIQAKTSLVHAPATAVRGGRHACRHVRTGAEAQDALIMWP